MYSVADLETFVTVARSEGITPAARHLGISPATTSHRIAKLEHALKVTLFHRTSRSFRLTDEGLIFFEKVDVILADLKQAEQEAGSGTAELRGHLRVTMSPWILSRFILPVLGAFRQRHPDLTLEFLSVDRFVSLAEEGQDCAIRVGRLVDSALVATKLCDNDRIICAAPAFLAQHGAPQTVAELGDAPWVALPWQRKIDVTDAAGRTSGLRIARNIEVSNSDLLTEAAVQGLGLAVKSRLAVKDEIDAGALVEVMPGRMQDADAPVSFVFAAEARIGRKTRAFGALAKAAFAQASGSLGPGRA